MIAHLQYAIDYRPYILKNNKTKDVEQSSKVGKPAAVSTTNTAIKQVNSAPQVLKANSQEVVSYMKTLANSVNDMKFSVKTLNRSITRFESNFYKDDELVQEFIDEDVDEFVKALNSNFKGTLSTELSGEKLNNYLGSIQQVVASNMDIIEDLGIDIKKGEAKVSDSPKNFDKIKKNAKKYSEMFSQVNDITNEMLSKSIYEHVKLNDMRHYVNYSFDYDTQKTFELFSEGIVLDIAI